MRPSNLLSRLLWGGLLLASLCLSMSRPAGGQELDRVRFGIGFVANAPSQMVGVGGYVLLPVLGGIGLYVDGKGDIDSPAEDRAFEEGLTAADVENDPRYAGTRFLEDETSWRRNYNVALVRPVNPFLMVYGGAGISQGEGYTLYDVPQGDVGRALWVRDPRGDENRVNFMVGLILRVVPSISSQLGFETQPRGFTAGLSLRLPPW
jgi:hypothetical protein